MPKTIHHSQLTVHYNAARLYHSTASVWLSVDPLSDKYPSASPYVYCAGNPVRLVDPDGRSIIVEGEEWAAGFNDMQQGTNLELSRNENGIISAMGIPISDADYQLLAAINDDRVEVHIECVQNNEYNTDTGGSFMGATYYSNKTSESLNVVGVAKIREIEDAYMAPRGSGIIHEATEGYAACLMSIEYKQDIGSAMRTQKSSTALIGCNQNGGPTISLSEVTYNYSSDYQLYKQIHNAATYAPNEMTSYTSMHYKSPGARYIQNFNNEILLNYGK